MVKSPLFFNRRLMYCLLAIPFILVLVVMIRIICMILTTHSPAVFSPFGTIRTVAGTGRTGFSGDGGPAVSADLSEYLGGAAVDRQGNLFVADSWNARVRRITPDGTISTVAGCGRVGFSGDGGPAVRSSLNRPFGIAVDDRGDLYIADTGNNRVRKRLPDGRIVTVAGGARQGFAGDGGPATRAALCHPAGVAVDGGGALYIADTGNERVRIVTPDGRIDTVAGTGKRGKSINGALATMSDLSRPTGLAVDTSGNLYIADMGNHRICRVREGLLDTVAGTRTARLPEDRSSTREANSISAELDAPEAVAVGRTGELYIADSGNNRIRRVSPDGTSTTVAGRPEEGFTGDGGPANRALLDLPVGIAVDTAGDLYIAETRNHRVRKITAEHGEEKTSTP